MDQRYFLDLVPDFAEDFFGFDGLASDVDDPESVDPDEVLDAESEDVELDDESEEASELDSEPPEVDDFADEPERLSVL